MIQKSINKKMKGFTLVELLAVIAVLGLILIIAVPKIMDVLNAQKKRTFELTAKSIIKSAEEKYLENNAYGIEEEITCESIANITSSDYEYCTLEFDEEGNASVTMLGKGRYDNLNICKGTKINAVATIEKCPISFASDSWKTIVAAVKSGNHPYILGDTKTIDLGSLGTHTIRVANTTPCEGLNLASETACGFVLEFADVITSMNMNYNENTNVGGWPATTLRTDLNDEVDDASIYNLLPEDLRKGIIETTVVSGYASEEGEENFVSEDKLYLLSTKEVWGNSSGNYDTAMTDEITRQLDYYISENVSLTNVASAIKNIGESAASWWLRSTVYLSSNSFHRVGETGAKHYGDNYSQAKFQNGCGVSPAFRLAE